MVLRSGGVRENIHKQSTYSITINEYTGKHQCHNVEAEKSGVKWQGGTTTVTARIDKIFIIVCIKGI